MRATPVLVLAAFLSTAALAAQGWIGEALTLGRTHDDALFESFNKSYSLSPSGTIESAEIITEFRRAVLWVRERTRETSVIGPEEVAKAIAPSAGLVGLVAQARLHPQNTFAREPAYDLYISTGPRTPPIAPKVLKRTPIYPPGGTVGSTVIAVRLEASFPRADIERAAVPMLVVTDEKAEILWQARLDVSRYR